MEEKKVLVVDDDKVIRNAVAKIIKLDGYSVVSASGVEEALERFQDDFCLVVTDLEMPDGTGDDLASALLAQSCNSLKIICVTGNRLRASEIALMPFDQVLYKPFNIDELSQAVATVLS